MIEITISEDDDELEPELRPAVEQPADKQWGGHVASPMPLNDCVQIFMLLMKYCAAPDSLYTQFREYMRDPKGGNIREFRFQGNLGFGGKCHHVDEHVTITCYTEDTTPERIAVLKTVNELLGQMYPEKK